MPTATPAPPDWGWGDTMFGTAGMPYVFQGGVWASTGGSNYSCIYVDPTIQPGLDRIAYLPKNNFQVLLSMKLSSPGGSLANLAIDLLGYGAHLHDYVHAKGFESAGVRDSARTTSTLPPLGMS